MSSDIFEISSSRISIPFSKVSKNLISSVFTNSAMSLSLSFKSGKAELITRTISLTKLNMKGFLAPIL